MTKKLHFSFIHFAAIALFFVLLSSCPAWAADAEKLHEEGKAALE